MHFHGSVDKLALVLKNNGMIKSRTARVLDDHAARSTQSVWAGRATFTADIGAAGMLDGRCDLGYHSLSLTCHGVVRQTVSFCLIHLLNDLNPRDLLTHVLNRR